MENPIQADPNTIIKITEKTRREPEIASLIILFVRLHKLSVTPFAEEAVSLPTIIGRALAWL